MTTAMIQARQVLRRLFSVRLSPSIFLLAASYVGGEAFSRGALSQVGNNAFLLMVVVTLLAAIVAALLSLYQFVRYRSLQHLAEVVIAIWLFIRVADPVARFTAPPVLR